MEQAKPPLSVNYPTNDSRCLFIRDEKQTAGVVEDRKASSEEMFMDDNVEEDEEELEEEEEEEEEEKAILCVSLRSEFWKDANPMPDTEEEETWLNLSLFFSLGNREQCPSFKPLLQITNVLV
ncbi:hypothetical protein M0804_002357 [Polistes exclamans]|nr:hypothetical protein M0804_002357 [Polistes exclamans]